MTGQQGIALILVILVTSFLSAIGMGLALIVMMDGLASGNLRGSAAMLYAADAAIELAARELTAIDDWDRVLNGEIRSAFVDGLAGGVRPLPGGGALDLTAATNVLNCRTAAACTPVQMDATTLERPWGPNNARWRLFGHGPFASLGLVVRPTPCYIAVWLADDGREEDGDPLRDNPEVGAPGHGVLRIRAEAYGPAGSRRAIEAELARRCLTAESEDCAVGIRVQSWHEVRHSIP